MLGFINKVKRNMASGDSKSEFGKVFFSQRVIKATYPNDTKEPKMKHVECFNDLDFLDCLKGNIRDIDPENSFEEFYQKYKGNLVSWVHTMKCFIIFHIGMQDIESFPIICKGLVPKIPNMSSFLKPLGNCSYGKII